MLVPWQAVFLFLAANAVHGALHFLRLHFYIINYSLWTPYHFYHQKDDLYTIDSVALASLKEDMDIFPLPPETPMVPTPHTATYRSLSWRWADWLLHNPRKLTVVKNILQCERHKYSLQLLPYIFTREMSSSNTEGANKKLPLDTIKMNSLKGLVFNRFLVESREERLWLFWLFEFTVLLFFSTIDVIKFLRP